MKKIVVLFGGCSPEYGVSLESAFGVISAMDRSKFEPVPVGITKDGDWYYFPGDPARIADDTWLEGGGCIPAALSPNRTRHALLLLPPGGVTHMEIDAVFPVLHGRNGEDGTVQGACELAGIPLVGCGTLAGALCMDKDRAHRLVSLAGVRVPQSLVLDAQTSIPGAVARAEELGYPLFVKPVRAGSSYGITRVTRRSQLCPAIDRAFCFDDRVIVEQGIDSFEVGCAVMGGDTLVTGEVDEIELSGGFFDFVEKYNLVTSRIHVPARISPALSDRVKDTAVRIYRALDCHGFARVDMFLTPAGEIVFNEVNTIPGFTAHSRFPSMMRAAGIPFDRVITTLIEQEVGA